MRNLLLSLMGCLLLGVGTLHAQTSEITSRPYASTPLSGSEIIGVVQAGQPRQTTVSVLPSSGNYSLTNADVAAGGKIVDTIDANSITFPSPTVFNRSATSNHYTGSGCTPTDYDDMTVGWGHNLSNLFTRVNASYAASLFGMESNFCVSNRPSTEFYWRSIDTAGVVRSHLEATGAHNGTFGDLGLYGNIVNWSSFSGVPVTQWMKWDFTPTNPVLDLFTHNGLVTGNYISVRNQRNNAAWLQQRNAANSAWLDLPYFDGSDVKHMGSQTPVLWNTGRSASGTHVNMSLSSTGVAGGDKGFFVQLPTSSNWFYGWQMTGSFADNLYVQFSNTNNATTNAHTKVGVFTGGASAGDPEYGMTITGVITSYMGLDNTDNDAFVINANATDTNLGTGNILRIETTGTAKGAITLGANCTSSAAPAVCAGALAGSVVIAAAGTAVTVNTTAVTANSQILIQEDSSLGTKLGVTCNTTIARTYVVTARTAATSFVLTTSAAPVTNPACLSYLIMN